MDNKQLREFTEIARAYYLLKEKQEEANEKFEVAKKDFYSKMSKFWKKNKIKDKNFKDGNFSVTRVQSVKLIFNIQKFKEKLNKEQQKKLIKKSLEVSNTQGLVDFLKSKNISFKDVKDYFIIKEEVDQKMLDKLSDLGEISMNELKGTYTVEIKDPYYKLSVLEDEKDEGAKGN